MWGSARARASSDTATRASRRAAAPPRPWAPAPGRRAGSPRRGTCPPAGPASGTARSRSGRAPTARGGAARRSPRPTGPGWCGAGPTGPGRSGRPSRWRAGGRSLPRGVTNGARRRTVARRQDPGLVAPAPQRAGQRHHLALDATGDAQAVGADQADAHAADTTGRRRRAAVAPGPGGRAAGGAAQRLVVARPVRLEQVPLLGRPADQHLERPGQVLGHPGDVRAEPAPPFGVQRRQRPRRGSARPRSTTAAGSSGAPVRSAIRAGPPGKAWSARRRTPPRCPCTAEVPVAQQAHDLPRGERRRRPRCRPRTQRDDVQAEASTELEEPVVQLGRLELLHHRGHGVAPHLDQPAGRPLPATQVRQGEDRGGARGEGGLDVLRSPSTMMPSATSSGLRCGQAQRVDPVPAVGLEHPLHRRGPRRRGCATRSPARRRLRAAIGRSSADSPAMAVAMPLAARLASGAGVTDRAAEAARRALTGTSMVGSGYAVGPRADGGELPQRRRRAWAWRWRRSARSARRSAAERPAARRRRRRRSDRAGVAAVACCQTLTNRWPTVTRLSTTIRPRAPRPGRACRTADRRPSRMIRSARSTRPHVGVEAQGVGLGPHVGHPRGGDVTGHGQDRPPTGWTAAGRRSRTPAPPNSMAVGDAVGNRVEERAPHARPARGLGHGAVEQVGDPGQHQQQQAQAQGTGADGDRRAEGHDQADRGDHVGGDARTGHARCRWASPRRRPGCGTDRRTSRASWGLGAGSRAHGARGPSTPFVLAVVSTVPSARGKGKDPGTSTQRPGCRCPGRLAGVSPRQGRAGGSRSSQSSGLSSANHSSTSPLTPSISTIPRRRGGFSAE